MTKAAEVPKVAVTHFQPADYELLPAAAQYGGLIYT
jgi:hypothetical protein